MMKGHRLPPYHATWWTLRTVTGHRKATSNGTEPNRCNESGRRNCTTGPRHAETSGARRIANRNEPSQGGANGTKPNRCNESDQRSRATGPDHAETSGARRIACPTVGLAERPGACRARDAPGSADGNGPSQAVIRRRRQSTDLRKPASSDGGGWRRTVDPSPASSQPSDKPPSRRGRTDCCRGRRRSRRRRAVRRACRVRSRRRGS
ncbi:hypothetical protein D2E24_0345 [Bifidobacterium samirii]|uniref:Uncharacterized protein n=1 Tax=Bifidobacterium samirii TaxID=2306974 RepID=A0A430FWA1_9BIFI|nr:hypothetical protein D2E24_0345 [Bifidobacterium samirii]